MLIAGGNGNTIGGTSPAARNVISANKINGVVLSDPSGSNTVQGNYIGTNAAGTAALGNTGDGIELANSANNLIGGTAAGAGNVIAASTNRGVFITTGLATGNSVQENRIGTNATGTVALGNTLGGVSIANNASNNTIGGTSAAARNVISGNTGFGVEIHGFSGNGATGNVIQGNFIGTDVSGASALGNGGNGIDVIGTANSNTIGGTTAGAGNTIEFNGGVGVGIFTGTGNAILGNSIFSNTGLGIDLGSPGVTANDACDADTGPNNLQNFPVITAATASVGSTNIQGTLNSTASTGPFRVEFFASPSCHAASPNDFGEGKTFLGIATPSTDSSCNATFNVTLSVTVSAGSVITATATDPGNNTSEFSQCFAILVAPTATNTPTNTPTSTPTNTPAGVATNTPTNTSTGPASTPTATPSGLSPTPTPVRGVVVPVLSPWMLGLLALALVAAAFFVIRRS